MPACATLGPLAEYVWSQGRAASAPMTTAAVLADPGDLEVGVDVFLGGVVGGDEVVPPAFLVEPEERPSSLGAVVGDPERAMVESGVRMS